MSNLFKKEKEVEIITDKHEEMRKRSKKRKKKRKIILSIAAVALIIIVVAVMVSLIIQGNGSQKKCAKKFLEAEIKEDKRLVEKCYAHKNELTDYDYSSIMYDMDGYEFDIYNTENISKSHMEEIFNTYSYKTFVKKEDVQKMTAVYVKCSKKLEEYTDESYMVVYVGKYKGEWKVICIV